ncbi:MAG TPA: CDF family Co(II)/Ni(II) efflux transporter DmeF [Rhizomicrobium sp.]|jgi:cation diffusion facilitator family transporter|nr:CDF family Co(II)/Ni(II) efflux transporter DmeF [Rhizomicrobium sp.]
MTDTHNHGLWTHDHHFLGHGHERAESRARAAALVTALFMLVEIGAGLIFRSMALLADGIHMATHVGALGLAAGAYWLARRHVANTRFTFGSGKFGDLAAFTSAIVLGVIALGVAVESLERLLTPVGVDYRNALIIAAIGLAVNVICAFILADSHDHDHGHGHHTHDHNMRAAYVHVLADAATSVLALAALAGGLFFGLRWLDPLVGLIGAGVIASWAYGLTRDSGMVLLDAEADPELAHKIRMAVENEFDARVADLHLWRLGPGHHGLILSLVSPGPATAENVKTALRARYPDLSHVTIEVAVCADCT